ncbi:MAG: hypothetical protein J6V72_02595 [Kiritimatiellae bacterium]|nr:hypothetical protein [Kiritimatiellia bacterium]
MSEEIHNNMDPFRYMVRRFIAIDSPNLIENSSPAHAKILLEEMFANAQKSAYVYCGRISDTVWGGENLANAVRAAIARGVEVRFIVQHPEDIPQNSVVAEVLREHGENTIHTSREFAQLGSHFAVFDDKMYRFEKDDGDKKAIACVNAPDTARSLRELAQAMLRVA